MNILGNTVINSNHRTSPVAQKFLSNHRTSQLAQKFLSKRLFASDEILLRTVVVSQRVSFAYFPNKSDVTPRYLLCPCEGVGVGVGLVMDEGVGELVGVGVGLPPPARG